MKQCTLILFLLITCNTDRLFAQVFIFNSSPTAMPGEAIALQGSFSKNAKAYIKVGSSGSGAQLAAFIKNDNLATATIPTSMDLNVYQVWIEDQGQRSPIVFVNRALGMHLDSPDASPGGNLRIYGRNLQLQNNAAGVRFQEDDGSASFQGIVNTGKSDAYELSVKLPANLQVGKTYKIFVRNGLSGNEGETQMAQKIAIHAADVDYFELGVGWASKLNFYRNVYNVKTDSRLSEKAVGDGNANDQPAIQQAIDLASAAGGGIVYLPAGKYKLTYRYFEYIRMRSRVVVQGAGKDQTIIQFGYELAVQHLGVYWPPATVQAGLADLTLENIDNYGSENLSNSRGEGSEIFIQRIRFKMNLGDWLWLAESDKLVIANSEFSHGLNARHDYRGPMQLNGCTNFVIRDNIINFAVEGINLNDAHDGVFENNKISRDGAARYPGHLVNHVLILNFSENLSVKNNLFKVINGPAQNRNDGEAIISEGGGIDKIDEEAGVVSSASATTIVDNSKNWQGFRRRPVVAIVSGRGVGQWRNITSRTGNVMQIDKAWDVVPTAGSHYAIFNWGSRNWLLYGNTFEGNRRGITLYHNATTDVAIVKNTLVNSGSIDLTPYQLFDNGQKFVPMFNNQVIGNSVSNTDRTNGNFIGIHTVQHMQSETFGTSVIGFEMRGNTVVAGQPNTPAIVDAPFPEGFLNYLEFHPVSNYIDRQIPAIQGSIIEGNKAINCQNAIYLNPGSYNTFICSSELVNSPNLIDDASFDGIVHKSVSTIMCNDDPLPVILTSFTASKIEGFSQLEWLTSSESEASYFEIQRFKIPLDWVKIGEVQASGESNDKRSYSFRDTVPGPGQNLYRLKMIDQDTYYTYSKVASVTFESLSRPFLYPNPFADAVYLSGELQGRNAVEIYNITGLQVFSESEFPTKGVSLKHLAPGVYTFRIISDDGHSFTERVVKIP
ncbi:T9SS type A sorting domain-containing protein [Dyadobacter sp. CY327]|uniref:T9SS type A sorting domain-containing protein n=1 Tax=Dyadobacter sp. CY327 TaxID=2907301 RepID=UPI001F1F4943|nr:glycosyl hydrolase family 28-related protein [Dyadobacter sp. CY327]MCE7071034.1 T9SS type A sorting domain-containing protein [Dyadobacter sp. CY327]